MTKLACALLTAMTLAGCQKASPQHHLEAARNALFERSPQVALSEFKQALDLLERDESAQASLYRARALRGAADVYAFHLSDPKQAIAVYRELIRRCPEAPETLEGRVHLATILRHDFHDTRGAIAELTQALARNPPQSAELAYEVATLYFEIQDYSQSEIEAAKVARKFETSAFVDDALYLRGQALALIEGRRAEAEQTFLEIIERHPDSLLKPHAQVELGRLLATQGHAEQAIEKWVEALKSHPEPAVVQNAITRTRAQLRATTPRGVGDAIKAFDRDQPPPPQVTQRPPAKNSIEAVGGTAEEAAEEAKMKGEATPSSVKSSPD